MMGDAAFFGTGLLMGTLYFALLRWNTSLYTRAGSIGLAAGLQLIRLVGLGGVLAVIAEQGNLPLLFAALGVLVARPCVVRMMAR